MMTAPALMLLAWTFELIFGWPDWLYKRIRHPVVWFGAIVAALESFLNKDSWSHRMRYATGTIAASLCISIAAITGWGISALLPSTLWGVAVEGLIASSLIASRSLYAHVAAVMTPLQAGDVKSARQAVSMIVGRDPSNLDEAGIVRAGLESLAENTSDGVIAPLFWGALLGLPGLAAYKAINTLDSMIGHQNERYVAFGGFAARLDDIANLIPARLTGLLFAVTSLSRSAFHVMLKDAHRHRSPNAGWPEAAMAGTLGVRLSGPRDYGVGAGNEPWLNGIARNPAAADMSKGLELYRRTLLLAGGLLLVVVILTFGAGPPP